MKRLFVTDMDGTLLGNDGQVSQRSSEIISALSRDGVAVTVATARTAATVEPLMEGTFTSVPAILLTGAAMWDRGKRCYFNVHTLPPGASVVMARCFDLHDVSPFVYTLPSDGLMRVYHRRILSPQEKKFYIDRAHLRLKRFCFVRELDTLALDGPVVLMLGIAPMDRISALAARLEATGEFAVSAYPDIFNPSMGYIEVFAGGVSKAAAVKELKEMTGAEMLTVYGDNLNDLTMFAVADEAVAVDNALPEVKAAASRVIGRNSADAVALDILNNL